MTVDELIAQIEGVHAVQGDRSAPISDLTDDSRSVKPHCAFIARPGVSGHGPTYITQALAAGARVVFLDAQIWASLKNIPSKDPTLKAVNPRDARVTWVVLDRLDQAQAGRLAERFFGYPSRKLGVIGITGTNGKTTTAFLTQHLLNWAGYKCGLLSTVINDDGRDRRPAALTTLGAVEFSRQLAAMAAHGCQAAVAEVSSHALDQGRTDAIHFKVAVFTNLTGDHLDYHGDLQRYAKAKARLFDRLPAQAWAVVNGDDLHVQTMLGRCPAIAMICRMQPDSQPTDLNEHVVDGSINDAALYEKTRRIDCIGSVLRFNPTSSHVTLDGPWGSLEVALPLVGRHNVMNALEAVAAANALTATEYRLHAALISFPGVPGRLERVQPPETLDPLSRENGPTLSPAVFVDYAHTHDALENVLVALRPLVKARLILVFGCGGDRDRTKRPKMAAVACRLADRVVITSDNPRTEDPTAIIEEILAGVPADARKNIHVESDRAAAIDQAICDAQPEDTVLVAGKGHEDYQIIGTDKRPFDDRLHAQSALRRRIHNSL